MGADLDLIERAIVLQITVVYALTNRTFNGLVCMTAHVFHPPFWITALVLPVLFSKHKAKESKKQAKRLLLCYSVLEIFSAVSRTTSTARLNFSNSN